MTQTQQNKSKFKIGDKVTLLNDYGIYFPGKTITKIQKVSYSNSGFGYYIEPSDSPWFAVKEENLILA